MSLFAYAGVFFVCAVVAVLIGFAVDEHFGRSEDYAIFAYTFLVFCTFLVCGVVALVWGALKAMGWLL
jgi:hypothetical protein